MTIQRYQSSQDRQNQVFLDFLKGRKVLVADPSSLVRSSVGKILTSLGITGRDLVLVAQFEEAKEVIMRHKPGLIICEYEFGAGEFSVELFEASSPKKMDQPLTQKPIMMVLSGNVTEVAIARIARSEADLYVFKPFAPETLREQILKISEMRSRTNEYLNIIQDTRKEISEGRLDQAIKMLTLSKSKYTPTSENQFLVKQLAKGQNQTGVLAKRSHFKCLMDIYELLHKQNRTKEAYAILKLVHPYQPLDQFKLIEVIQLVVRTQNFSDLGYFFDLFCKTTSRSDELIKNMHAALVVAAKLYAKLGDKPQSELFFARAVKAIVGRDKLLRPTIETMLENGIVNLASESMNAFHASERSKTDYIALDFYIRDKKNEGPELIFKGWKLLDEGHRDPLIYKVMIRRLVALKKVDPAENLVVDGAKRWPHLKALFLDLCKNPSAN